MTREMRTDIVSEHRYLSIGEVLAHLQDEFPDVTISKIRFLESQGLIDPERTPSGYRKFYESDIERLRFILREQREHFLPLKVIRDRLDGDGEPSAADPAATTTGAATEAAGSEPDAQRVPIWMQKISPRAQSLLTNATGASFTFEELCTATGLSADELRQVELFGLIGGRPVGRATFYDEEALVVGKLAAGFLRHGIEPRHLKMYKNAAEREAGLFEQVILPLVKQRNPQARSHALDILHELSHLGAEMRQAMLRHAVRSYTEGA